MTEEKHVCMLCDTPPFFNPPHPIIYCGKDPEVRTIQILDLKSTLDSLYEKCPKKVE